MLRWLVGWCWLDVVGWVDILPETNSSQLNMDGWNTSFLLGWPIFRGYVSFRECICFQIWCLEVQQTWILRCMLQKSFEQKYRIKRKQATDNILPYWFCSSFRNSPYISVKTLKTHYWYLVMFFLIPVHKFRAYRDSDAVFFLCFVWLVTKGRFGKALIKAQMMAIMEWRGVRMAILHRRTWMLPKNSCWMVPAWRTDELTSGWWLNIRWRIYIFFGEHGHTPSWYQLQIIRMCMDGCAFMIKFVCNIRTPMSSMNLYEWLWCFTFLDPSNSLDPPAWCVVFLKKRLTIQYYSTTAFSHSNINACRTRSTSTSNI